MAAASKSVSLPVSEASCEHISLQADPTSVRSEPNPRRPLRKYKFTASGRNFTQSVAVLQDYHVLVATQRSGASVQEHTADLRFVDPTPVGIRKIALPFLYAGIAATVLALVAIGMSLKLPEVSSGFGGWFAALGLGSLALGCFGLCVYLTTESLVFLSVHGRARVISIVGRVGTIRRAGECATDIVKQIASVQTEYQKTPQKYLRDEMREHFRLHEEHVLSDEQYDDAKGRILKAHG
jgi:DNA-binding FrmR family transcriptional regulator